MNGMGVLMGLIALAIGGIALFFGWMMSREEE